MEGALIVNHLLPMVIVVLYGPILSADDPDESSFNIICK